MSEAGQAAATEAGRAAEKRLQVRKTKEMMQPCLNHLPPISLVPHLSGQSCRATSPRAQASASLLAGPRQTIAKR